jgi:hypothetical protein
MRFTACNSLTTKGTKDVKDHQRRRFVFTTRYSLLAH